VKVMGREMLKDMVESGYEDAIKKLRNENDKLSE